MRTPAEGAGARDQAGGSDRGDHTAPDKDKQGDKPAFAPLPTRALADTRLSALDFRVLAVIAAHDRFSKNGTGCYASHLTLAGLVRCHLKSLSRSLRALGEFGYVVAEWSPLKRRRDYRVVYTDDDKAALERPEGNETVTPEGNETVTEEWPEGNETVPLEAPLGNRPGYPEEILLSSEEITRSVEKNSAEAAPVGAPAMKMDGRGSVVPAREDALQDAGMFLRKTEERLKATEGRPFTKGEVDYFRHHADHCAQLEDRWIGGSEEEERIGYWAQRLYGEIMDKMVEAA